MQSFVLAALAGFAAATPMDAMDYKFINYIAKHGKSYATSEEYAARKALFAKMDAEIDIFNATETTSTHGHNFMSDYTEFERSRMTGTWDVKTSAVAETPAVGSVPDWTTGVNWVTAGAVAPVKDQGQCGSCWAFSSVGTLESAYHIAMHKTGTVTQFSEQQLVDCVKSCYGCSGGW
jgi:C1A family cysteine protease